MNKNEFMQVTGMPVRHSRNFSLYDGSSYECVCGKVHVFSQFSAQHVTSKGSNANFVVQCPNNSDYETLIKTKNKFFFLFDGFVSLVGTK